MTLPKLASCKVNRLFQFGIAVALIAVAVPARAEASGEEFLRAIDGGSKELLHVLNGYAVGFLWANAEIGYHRQPLMFCAPRNLTITVDQNADILRQYLKDHPTDGKLPAGMALLMAYKATFPCPASN